MINERNRGKRGLAIELGTERGREIFRELVAISDVVIQNFSTRVMAKWDLDYPQLREINSQIILCSIYSQGAEGPESGFVSFGGTLEQIGGITNLTGYANELPGGFTIQLPDPLGGTIATGPDHRGTAPTTAHRRRSADRPVPARERYRDPGRPSRRAPDQRHSVGADGKS